MRVRSLIVVLPLLLFASTLGWSQCKELKWPEDKKKAEECVAVWGDAMKAGGNLKSAVPAIQWMLTNAPQWNTKLYIDGITIYDRLADAEADPGKKKVLVDSLLMLFDLRVKNCNDEVNVLNRKAYASFKFNQKSKEALPSLLSLYDRVFEISGTNVTDGNLVAYMTTIKNNQTLHKNLTEEQILQRYDKVSAVLDAKIAAAKAIAAKDPNKAGDVDKLKGISDAVNSILAGLVNFTCDRVKSTLAPKFKQNPNDLALAKKIFKFMLEGKCADDPLALDAGEAIHTLSPENERDFGLLKFLIASYISKGQYDRAEALLKEAMTMPLKATEKGEAQFYMGSIEAKKKNYSAAREMFRQAATADASNKEAWEKIGDLYYNSFDDCSKKSSLAEDRLVYIAAYEMYQKAGNSAGMARAKAQFPSKEEIFLLNWQKGSTQRVGCWIQESVVLNTRD